jgi:signal transduction histidine kinase/CheY-like chemotaxis protein
MTTADPTAELERLRKRVERERRARQEAEALAEQGTRQLYEHGRQMRLLYVIADASARATTVEEALQKALDELCAYTGWPIGHAYLVKHSAIPTLVSARLWHQDQPEATAGFREVSEAITFRLGEGLPGRVLETGEPVWLCDVKEDTNFPRAKCGKDLGVRVAFGIPVTVAKSVVAVLEFFSREAAPPDHDLIQLARQVGTQIGRIFERQAREEADRANKAKSEFLSRMSHELRTPLNAILGFGQLLELDQLTVNQRIGVTHILKGGRHLLNLIDEVLDISRIESGYMHYSLEPVPVMNLLTEALDMIQPMASQRKIPLENSGAEAEGRYVMADRQRLKQILLNLLSNAVKYNREAGRVIVSYSEEKGRVRLSVRDCGVGIPAHKLEMLFTPFERLGAEQGSVEGTGLGLALSKRLAEMMGGGLGVESNPGEGSTFWVELAGAPSPLGPADAAHIASDDVRTSPASRSCILYIEDNYPNLQLVERVLSSHRPEFRLISASTPAAGIELAVRERPELILLDLNLAEMSGHEVLIHLQGHPATSTIPVVIVSADATPGQIRRLLAAGAAAYLTKPIDLPRFLRTLDELVTVRENGTAPVGAGIHSLAEPVPR